MLSYCKRLVAILGVFCLMSYLWFLDHHRPKSELIKTSHPISVAVESIKPVTEGIKLQAFGNTAPFNTISVRALMDGQITDIHFKEGDHVKANQALFSLDSRLIRAQLHASQASLQKDLASLDIARFNLQTTEGLFKKGFASAHDLENDRSLFEAALATVEADKANVEVSNVQLSYTTVDAPIEGHASNTVLKTGNLVQSGVTEMVTINQIDPIYVVFNLPETKLEKLKKALELGHEVKVAAKSSEDSTTSFGKISSFDNQFNDKSGTLQIKAIFDNKDQRLVPGQYVKLALDLGSSPGAILCPQSALNRSAHGTYVFVVKRDLRLEKRMIQYSGIYKDSVLVTEGLELGEQVVAPLNAQLTHGMKIELLHNK